jgi:rod shape-determining protein MreC
MVKRQVGSLAWFMTPFRAWNQRMTLALLGAAAIALLAIEKTNPEVAESARGAAADVIAPILDLLSRPSASAAQAIDSVRELGRLREENAQLKQQQARLLQWQATGLRLDRENQELRKLLNLAPDPKARFVTARVVGGSGGAFVRSILVAAGSKDGVRKNQAAITGEGLIGRVSARRAFCC